MNDRVDRATLPVGMRVRIRYHFDNLLSRGTWAVLVFLGAITLAALIISALILAIAGVAFDGSEGSSVVEDFWQSMLRVIDPGTMADDSGWGQRLLALLVTVFGILIAGTLIGLIASGVEQRVDEMQRGRSVVVESGHVLILGDSPRLPVIVKQLTLASRKRRGNAIVVLADREPRELSDDVRSFVADTRGSRLVFRWGDPTRRADLALVGVSRARAVIVLADDDAEGDAGVVKATLAVGAELGRYDTVPVVAELNDPETAKSLLVACGGQVHPVVPMRGIGRITAFTLGEPGLNQVVEELLDFRGGDIYLRPVGEGAGSSFAETVGRFAKARPIGLVDSHGDVDLNPPPETVIGDHDRLVVVADDDNLTLRARHSTAHRATPTTARALLDSGRRRERYLIVGWNALGRQLVDQLEHVVAPGSSVEVVYDSRLFAADEVNIAATDNVAVTLTPSQADTWRPADDTELSEITSIVFLGYRRGTSVEEADSRTLLNVMSLRRQMERQGEAGPRVVAELLNADNVELARMTGADDFLVSDAIASRFITQIADQPERRGILMSLYEPEGPSVRLVAAAALGVEGKRGWDEVVDTAYSEGLLALGWREAVARGGRLVLNPDTSDRVDLEPDDHVVVIG